MIDEDRTMQLFGYVSNDWATKSGKKIVAVCEECGKYRVVVKQAYRDLCRSCASKRRKRLSHTEETKKTFVTYRRNKEKDV